MRKEKRCVYIMDTKRHMFTVLHNVDTYIFGGEKKPCYPCEVSEFIYKNEPFNIIWYGASEWQVIHVTENWTAMWAYKPDGRKAAVVFRGDLIYRIAQCDDNINEFQSIQNNLQLTLEELNRGPGTYETGSVETDTSAV